MTFSGKSTKRQMLSLKTGLLKLSCYSIAMLKLSYERGVSNNWFIRLFVEKLVQHNRKETLCGGDPPVTVWIPFQTASNGDNFSMPWRHHVTCRTLPNWPIVTKSLTSYSTSSAVLQDVTVPSSIFHCSAPGHYPNQLCHSFCLPPSVFILDADARRPDGDSGLTRTTTWD